jgi:hypothetical protein
VGRATAGPVVAMVPHHTAAAASADADGSTIAVLRLSYLIRYTTAPLDLLLLVEALLQLRGSAACASVKTEFEIRTHMFDRINNCVHSRSAGGDNGVAVL